jgi:hypothetical protein
MQKVFHTSEENGCSFNLSIRARNLVPISVRAMKNSRNRSWDFIYFVSSLVNKVGYNLGFGSSVVAWALQIHMFIMYVTSLSPVIG